MQKRGASELRIYQPSPSEWQQIQSTRRNLYFLLDDVQDTYNIGSFFRMADAMGVRKMYLSGRSECPPNHRIQKAAVGTEDIVAWEYLTDPLQALASFKSDHAEGQTIAIELADNSIGITDLDVHLPLLLILGHETDGISQPVLDASDQILQLPMYGVNISMNVVVSAAMALGVIEGKLVEERAEKK